MEWFTAQPLALHDHVERRHPWSLLEQVFLVPQKRRVDSAHSPRMRRILVLDVRRADCLFLVKPIVIYAL